MAVRLAINGFGRIGRLVLRALHESGRDDLEVVAVNDLGPVETNAHLLKYDSAHGRFPGEVRVSGDSMDLGRGPIRVLAERDPARLPWGEMQVDVALECTGLFRKREQAEQHLSAGARRVLISAPAEGADLTVVFGVNDDRLKPEHTVVSNASCTTNCLAPVAAALHRAVGIEHGYMTTIHAYTGDQRLVDTLHKDLHRARAAAQNMIPTSTGAAKAVGLVLPELKGKLDGCAIRVPTINVSLVDLTFAAGRDTSIEAVNKALTEAEAGPLKGVIETTDEPLVSSDFNHHPASAVVDVNETQVIEKRFVRVMAWYDNEWGFSNRMLDTAAAVGGLG